MSSGHTIHYFEDIAVGTEASFTRRVTDADIRAFAGISGDENPVHLDDAYASKSAFKQRIAHGMLTAAYISTVFGTILPGPGSIYLSQTLNFKAPVFVDDEVTATVRATEILEAKKRVLFHCTCRVGTKVVLEGEAVIIPPSRA